jgi:hypothetical protein
MRVVLTRLSPTEFETKTRPISNLVTGTEKRGPSLFQFVSSQLVQKPLAFHFSLDDFSLPI